MKEEQVVCDICGDTVEDPCAHLVLTFHPAHGMTHKVTLDLCERHAAPTWGRVKAAAQKGDHE